MEKAVADLRRRALNGEFSANEGRLPSTRELTEHYGLSRQAIGRAVSLLKVEGMLFSRRGAAVYARQWQPLHFFPQAEFKRRLPEVDIYKTALRDSGRDGSARMDAITAMPAEDPIRSQLGLREGEYVGVRLRTNIVDGTPVHTDDSYVPLRLVEGTDWMLQDNVERGTNKVLEELGHELVRAVDISEPRMTRPDEAERLGLGKGNSVPAIEMISTAYDQDDNPVQVTRFVLPAFRNVVVYERHKYPAAAGDE
ncbi:GntR family transcriptional regulator [Streptomyces sp. NPDC050485]|uniref:GntR family transcriptional regulator n=1 Tax=Streptomyces sp. NPDC050485 TaxID=3365617 RepID=UPI0037B05601